MTYVSLMCVQININYYCIHHLQKGEPGDQKIDRTDKSNFSELKSFADKEQSYENIRKL